MNSLLDKPYQSMTYFGSTLGNITKTAAGFITPNNWLAKFLISALTLLGGIKVYVFAVLSLALLDVITGVIASKKMGKPLVSKVFWRGMIGKFAMYLMLLIAVFHLDLMLHTVFPLDKFYMVFVMSLLISVYEVTSIIENVVAFDSNLAFLKKFALIWSKIVNKQIDGINQTVTSSKEDKADKADATEEKAEVKEG